MSASLVSVQRRDEMAAIDPANLRRSVRQFCDSDRCDPKGRLTLFGRLRPHLPETGSNRLAKWGSASPARPMSSRGSEAADESHVRNIGLIDGEAALRTPTQIWRADRRRSRLATIDRRRLRGATRRSWRRRGLRARHEREETRAAPIWALTVRPDR